MATCLIDAIEGRYVATADIPEAFLQADMDEDVWIKFEGEMVDILVSIDKDFYGPCVWQYKNKRFLYSKAPGMLAVATYRPSISSIRQIFISA